ncbi:MAG: prolyl oligopeptidase family serine peptidase [Deltaproteobacteria bacterium]|nr:prolyl oligopeptidase family serine peptidase [Deltaproteobacteria bacterium]
MYSKNPLFTIVAALITLGLSSAALARKPSDSGYSLEARLVQLKQSVVHGGILGVSEGTLATLESYIEDVKRKGDRDESYATRMTRLVSDALDAAENGRDLVSERRGFFWRGYQSRYSTIPQMYSIYVPDEYDGKTPMPLIVSLHGGSSNHNVWMALILGNPISTKEYWASFRTEFQPRSHPKAIVVAPDGLGQVRWRWMGEQDVLDVIEDVKKNYAIDSHKIFLTGLSNGGIGAYTIGLKHASRFAGVLPEAGVTDWLNHYEAQARWRPAERVVLANESAITYAENGFNTNFVFFHGTKDPGFSVEQARSMANKLSKLKVPFHYLEYDLGHDLTHLLWRSLQIMRYVNTFSRPELPSEVRLVTVSGRANRQAWLVLDDTGDHVKPGRIRAKVLDRGTVDVETANVKRFTILLEGAPVSSPVTIRVDGRVAYEGPFPADNRITLSNEDTLPGVIRFGPWDGALPEPGTRKTLAMAGPLGDANYDAQIHVYGTLVPEDKAILRRAAELGARGWMMARDYTAVRHPVIPDTALTPEIMRTRTVVLYGNARNNRILAEIGASLPIGVGEQSLMLRDRKIEQPSAGARFVCPNPLAPDHYLVVQAGVTAQAVEDGGKLPIYLADYIVYDARTTKSHAFMILASRQEVETGFFTEEWKLPALPAAR